MNINYKVCSFYKFINLTNLNFIKEKLLLKMIKDKTLGTILLSQEGINGSIVNSKALLLEFILFIKKNLNIKHMTINYTSSFNKPFNKTRVKIKNEIVSLGFTKIENKIDNTYINPEDWNDILNHKDYLILDVRNDYEQKIGSFKNSIKINTKNFKEFVDYYKKNLIAYKNKKIAMFCTGGIRCEKAISFLQNQDFIKLKQLSGGIINYLNKIDKTLSLWKGECFVFDSRVSINQNLTPGNYIQCYACRRPLSKIDLLSKYYIVGLSCSFCILEKTEKQIQKLKDRNINRKINNLSVST